jgi:exopolysaccharide biosynthesis polyprenyl glycosylphosphotransferase
VDTVQSNLVLKELAQEDIIVPNENKVYLFLKRLIDIVGSGLGILILIPVFLIIGILIKLEDPKGSVFFSQKRNGLNGKEFNMYKFRSMVHNAEDLLESLMSKNEMDGPVFKIKDDPRITKIGKFIRKTSLDELPQLFNVLKGDMSLVGPRPPIPREVIQYNKYQYQRLLVKPGITCYWQISGRNNIDFDEWVELDLKYIKERNLFKDIYIILMTLPVLLGDKNAS